MIGPKRPRIENQEEQNDGAMFLIITSTLFLNPSRITMTKPEFSKARADY